MEVSKGSFKIENSDGSNTELGFVMPYEIASKLMIAIMSWKDDWVATTKTVEIYQQKETEFLNSLKEKADKQ